MTDQRNTPDFGAAASAPRPTVVAVIPAYNEAERIQSTVRAALSIPAITYCIVVDDGSRDDTAALAQQAGAKVIRLLGNAGKGGALQYGATRTEDADYLLLLDGDLGDTASQGALLLEPVLAGEADMAIATFPKPTGKAGFGLVKNMARKRISQLGGGYLSDAPLSGQRALTRECLDATLPFGVGYGVEVTLTVRALRAGFRLVEVPTTMAHAATGRDLEGFIHRGRQFVHVWLALRKLKKEGRAT